MTELKKTGRSIPRHYSRIYFSRQIKSVDDDFTQSKAAAKASDCAELPPPRRSPFARSGPESDAVLVCTTQSYLPAKRRFVNKMGFAMEQFDERILKTVQLPEELCEADLLAVARIHFPELASEYLQFVVNTALRLSETS